MHAMNKRPYLNDSRGFTLVELMVVVLLTGIAVIAIYRGYTAFSHSADAQEQIIEMQQNLRIGMHILEKDLRRACMNEEEDENAGFTLDRSGNGAGPSSVSFTMDLGGTDPAVSDEAWGSTDSGDGDLTDELEWLTYTLAPVTGTDFFNLVKTDENNGDPDNPIDMNIITNVDALNFVYLDENEMEIDEDTTPDDPATGRTFLSVGDMADIRSVQVAMVVRTTNEDYRHTNSTEYRNLQDDLIYLAPGDNFRRRLYIKQFKIRNAGL